MGKTLQSRIGIDLGGTKIEAIVMAEDGTIVCRSRVDTPRDGYAETLDVLAGITADVANQASLSADRPIGIGTPGAVSLKTGLLMNCNSTCLNGKPLREDLESLTGRQVRIANDADCFTLSEASDGAAEDAESVFGVILGTGVGGGLVYHKQLVQGVNAIAGEWGHNPLPLANYQPDSVSDPIPQGTRPCFCGRANCVEAWLAGPSFERSYAQASGKETRSMEIVNRASAGESLATDLLEQYCNLLAMALANVINIVDPGAIVLGGGMSNTSQLYDRLPHYLPRYIFSDQVNTEVVQARFGDSSGVRGAAWLWSK